MKQQRTGPRSFDLTRDRPATNEDVDTGPVSGEELAIAEAIAIVVADLKTGAELTAARASVESAMYYLDGELAVIKSQIEMAKARAHEGTYSDRDWWRRVNTAQRFKGRTRQQLQNKFGEINRRMRQEASAQATGERVTKERAFVRIAEIHLPPATYQRLWQLVDQTMAAGGAAAEKGP